MSASHSPRIKNIRPRGKYRKVRAIAATKKRSSPKRRLPPDGGQVCSLNSRNRSLTLALTDYSKRIRSRVPQGALFKMGEDAPSDNSGRSQPPQPLYCGPRFRLEMVQAATILRSPEGCLREGTFGAAVPKGYWWFVPLNLILCRGAQFRRPVTYWIPPARGLRLRCALSSACGLIEER